MIEEIVLNYLTDKLSISVSMEEPEDAPAEYIIIERIGGGSENYIKNASITVQSYADSLYKAALLNKNVEEAMQNIIELDSVSRCELDSSYNFTDTTKKKYRYQAVFDLVYYD